MAQPQQPQEAPDHHHQHHHHHHHEHHPHQFSLRLQWETASDSPEEEDIKAKEQAITEAVTGVIHGQADLIGNVVYCNAHHLPKSDDLAKIKAELEKIFPVDKFSAVKALSPEERDAADISFEEVIEAAEKVQVLEQRLHGDPKLADDQAFMTEKAKATRDVVELEKKLCRITGRPYVAQEGVIDVILNRTPPNIDLGWPHAATFEELNLQTGDVILFAGVHKTSIYIRQVQWSCYSHAAIVLKKADGKLFILQSNGATGVTLDPLVDYIGAYDGRVVVRKLTVDDKLRPHIQTKMEDFVNFSLNLPYTGKLDFVLMYIETVIRGKGMAAKRAFFCSQLVAQAYMEFGILKPRPLASVYVPERFAHDTKLALPLINASLASPPAILPNKWLQNEAK